MHARETATVTLDVVAGPIRGARFVFDGRDTFIFGRAPDCHARLPEGDVTASRYHFILEVQPPLVRVRDLGSLNGTHVNARPIGSRGSHESASQARQRRFPDVDLVDGDRIAVGQTVFTVTVRDAAATGSAAATEVHPMLASPRAEQQALDAMLHALLHDAPGSSEVVAQFPGYELLDRLGQGGMGVVHRARRERDGAIMAIKVMRAQAAVSEQARRFFQREIEVMQALRHPNIVAIVEHGSAGQGFYFVMEYFAGGSLEALIRRRGGPLRVREAMPIMLQVLDGLAYAHAGGYVHRDLKPENVLLTGQGGGVAKLTDFGLAKSFENAGFSGITSPVTIGGTVAFMAREQVTNFKFVKPVTDVWSIAATFYYALTGVIPRQVDDGQDPMLAVLTNPVVPFRTRAPLAPAALAALFDRALSDDPAQRPADAGAFAVALRAAF